MKVEDILQVIKQEELDYGTVWTEDKLVQIFNIKLPDLSKGVKEAVTNVRKFDLEKVNAYLMLNEQLLNQGKCFIQDKDIYRVPYINEIVNHINKYYSSSNRKFKRAEKLRKSFSDRFPIEAKEANNNANRHHSIRSSQDKSYQPMR